jgi:molybdate transport system substrate-binding protein
MKRNSWKLWPVVAALCLLAAVGAMPAAAVDVHVAVAANFNDPLKTIAVAFEKETGHHLVISSGSTGKLAAQIESGAPFDVLLAADAERPEKLEKSGSAVEGSRFTYALGKLVLWSRDPGLVDHDGKVLASERYKHLALANTALAPYGRAAQEVLGKLNLTSHATPRIVQGEDIGQTYQFVVSGAAELGFVAESQVRADTEHGDKGSLWIVPENLYAPIAQQAVLLTKGQQNPGAQALLAYLRTPSVRTILTKYGYGLP